VIKLNILLLVLGLGIFAISYAQPVENSLGDQIEREKVQSKLDVELQQLASQYSRSWFTDFRKLPTTNVVTIDALAKNDAQSLLHDLTTLGLRQSSVAGLVVSGTLPVATLTFVSRLESLHQINLTKMTSHQGKVTTQGVPAMYVDLARIESGLDGSGVSVGVISDSFNCFAESDDPEKLQRTAELDKASGDLPADAYALEEANDCFFRVDEGRALMQIVHDIAPRAKLVFYPGGNGLASTVNGIGRLINDAKVDIIVDDTVLGSETFFQNSLIAQAIKQATDQGVCYITAIGNSGRNAYQSAYNESKNSILNINAHNFAGEGEVDVFQRFSLPPGSAINLTLQWSNPAYSVSGPPGAQTDMDISIVNEAGTQVIASGASINISKDPIEFITFSNPEDSKQTTFNIMISKAAGEPPELIKYIVQGRFEGRIEEYATNSGSTYGRANVASAISVGAVDYRKTPSMGASSPVLQFFSSAGGDTPIIFSPNGDRLAIPINNAKPEIVGPDNVNTTFFNYDDTEGDIESDSLPNFLGTSASAPHVAGVVALLLQLNPEFQPNDIKKILQETAVDVLFRDKQNMSETIDLGAGVDSDSGSGFVDVQAAVNYARSFSPTPPNENVVPFESAPLTHEQSETTTDYYVITGAGSNDVVFIFLVFVWGCFLQILQWRRS